MSEKILITKPLLPNIIDYKNEIDEIFESQWITNMGVKHNKLEKELKQVLKTSNISLFNNGTIALLTAIKAMDLPIGSEVITTPFTFAATPHCIAWNGLKPVFCDIEPNTMTIDSDKIEELITPNTSAICAVHVYGFPCNVDKIDKIAKKHNLKVIYDAAHAFSTEINGKGIGAFGDITMFSFHATKLFNTIEGGCLTFSLDKLCDKIYSLRNFGIKSEEVVDEIGINGKMNEFQAAMGLLNLRIFREEQTKRAKIKRLYDEFLAEVDGIRVPEMPQGVTNSYQYYPIVVEKEFPLTRNEIYENLKKENIFSRKYFYPVCSDFECYKTAPKGDLTVVNDIKNKVLCLPFYSGLSEQKIINICTILKNRGSCV